MNGRPISDMQFLHNVADNLLLLGDFQREAHEMHTAVKRMQAIRLALHDVIAEYDRATNHCSTELDESIERARALLGKAKEG